MTSTITTSLDALADWRTRLAQQVADLAEELAAQELLDEADTTAVAALRDRLASDKLVLAFVAEFSRGKSELINAIFFADTGRRVLPATPGRTTMCPVELRFEADVPPRLALLPIKTRLRGLSLAELRPRINDWQQVPLNPSDPQSLVEALAAVTRTHRVTKEQAEALGFWNDSQPDDNPPQAADGTVEVPAWRHAIINYPHPLLKRGLVVIDTPGLNAIGAEPELTLSLLPSAHAVVFVLAADTGVTKSDLSMWRDHLAHEGLERFVVLNKIDALVDPLAPAHVVQEQIEQQRQDAANTLGVPAARVFPLSARDALAGRVDNNPALLQGSRLTPLEDALAVHLLPKRQDLLVHTTTTVVGQLRGRALRRLADRQRQQAEQLMELRGLRGKSGAKLRMLVERVESEMADFERCTARLAAMRAVHARLRAAVLVHLNNEGVRTEVRALHDAMNSRLLKLGAKQAFEGTMQRLREAVTRAATQATEMRSMLDGSFQQLNTEFGFVFVLPPVPNLQTALAELTLIETSYGRYLGLSQTWRMAAAGFAEQFRRMLLSKTKVVFENAATELDAWSKAAQTQVEVQLRERRRGYGQRSEALQRVQSASGDLELRIAEVQAHDEHLSAVHSRVDLLAKQLTDAAQKGPLLHDSGSVAAAEQFATPRATQQAVA
jgi:Dynamin family